MLCLVPYPRFPTASCSPGVHPQPHTAALCITSGLAVESGSS